MYPENNRVMNALRITLIQADLVWENIVANRDAFSSKLSLLGGSTDIIILPEMFSTGFTQNPGPFAEQMNGSTVGWMKDVASVANAVVTGSIIIREGSRYYNRLLWVTPEGEISSYDKYHLFRYAKEDTVFSGGKEKVIFTYKGWKIRPFICYDLRFPVWSANHQKEYDLGIYVASWPALRAAHWDALLMGRAIENQIYIAAVNRVGVDGNGFTYDGRSSLIDPQGRMLHKCGDGEEIITRTISKQVLEDYRAKFPAWKDMSVQYE